MKTFLWIFGILIAVLITDCQEPKTTREPTIYDTGRVQYFDLEGGFYGIVGTKGKWLPLNLPEDFQIDSLEIRFEAKRSEGVMTIQMWGTPIEIVKIEKKKN